MKVAILLTCFNRKRQTLSCLQSAYSALQNVQHFNFEFYLVDDGSTDGTFDAVKSIFPDVNIIKSSGDLYWNRGMRLAWKNASQANDFDFYLWLNDDLELNNDSFMILFNNYKKLDNTRSILCGSSESKDHVITYSGFLSGIRERIIPNGKIQECDYFNGNFVLIPKSVFIEVGMLDNIFHHSKGDFDYGLRSKALGINSYVTSSVIGYCERHDVLPIWCNPKYNLFRRIACFYTPLGADPFKNFIYENRHFGLLLALFHVFTIHLRLLFPLLWKLLGKDLKYLK